MTKHISARNVQGQSMPDPMKGLLDRFGCPAALKPMLQSSKPQSLPLEFVELPSDDAYSGCFVPISHKLRPNGYFYKWSGSSSGRQGEMFHRAIFRLVHGLATIPVGFDVDHMCGTRACANPEHLRLLPSSVHAAMSAGQRNHDLQNEAHFYWKLERCDDAELAKAYNISRKTARGWMTKWSKKPRS